MAARSGQDTIAAAGTAEAGPSTPTGRLFMLKALPGNVGVIYVGNDGAGDVTASNGFPLSAGQDMYIEVRRSLAEIYFDVANNGDGYAWVLLAL